ARSVIVVSLSVAAASASACCCSAPFNSAGANSVTRSTVTSLGDLAAAPSPVPPTDSATNAQFRHVDFQVASGIVLGIRYLRGTMVSTNHGAPIAFDDKGSFVIGIDTAE